MFHCYISECQRDLWGFTLEEVLGLAPLFFFFFFS